MEAIRLAVKSGDCGEALDSTMFLIFPHLRGEVFQGGAEARLGDNVVLHQVAVGGEGSS